MELTLRRTVTLLLTLSASLSLAQTPERDFGYSLFLLGQDDPYRAVSALKRLSYDANQTIWADKANLLIGRIYTEQQEAQAAVYHFTLVADGGTGPLNAPAQLMMWQQLCKNPPQMRSCVEQLQKADDAWKTGLPAYLRLYYLVLLGNELRDNVTALSSLVLQKRASELVSVSLQRQNLPLKRAWLAGLLSAVLPGLGQLYAGRWIDAVVAFLVNGALIAGTILLALPPTSSVVGALVLGAFASGFYGGNIYNAVSDAQRANEAVYTHFAGELETRFYPRVTLGVSGSELVFGYRFGLEPGVALVAPAPRE